MHKRRFVLLLLLCYWFQILFSKMPIYGAKVSFFIPLTVSTAMLFGEDAGGYSGLVMGLLTDFKWYTTLGVHALSYYLIGFFIGRHFRRNYQDNIAAGLILTGLASLFDHVFRLLIGRFFGTPMALAGSIMPLFLEIILNAGVFWILWQAHRRWVINWRLRY